MSSGTSGDDNDIIFQMSDANEEVVKLQNKIAELEEDKGNLQLHLVDFDELKGKNKQFQKQKKSFVAEATCAMVVVQY